MKHKALYDKLTLSNYQCYVMFYFKSFFLHDTYYKSLESISFFVLMMVNLISREWQINLGGQHKSLGFDSRPVQFPCRSDSCLKGVAVCFALSLVQVKDPSALPKSQCLALPSRLFPTIALQRSKSSEIRRFSGGALRHMELTPSIYILSI